MTGDDEFPGQCVDVEPGRVRAVEEGPAPGLEEQLGDRGVHLVGTQRASVAGEEIRRIDGATTIALLRSASSAAV
jgi:hypothetical protein